MTSTPKYSVIVPVYNRPAEVEELLQSLSEQTYTNFEVLLIDDGSTLRCDDVAERFSDRLKIKYFFKMNSGPGPSRNFGFEKASGEYLVAFDSDCIIPSAYFDVVNTSLKQAPLDAWGGPDKGSTSFTPVQQAMAYTMSSIFTTGGIRGGSSHKFQPRSFNMGMSRKVFEKTKGFQFDRLAEDIELSIRIRKDGFRIGLIPEAYVFHKRRTSFRQFFRQVSGFGKGRVQVARAHAGAIRIAHWFPAIFFCGLFAIPFIFFFSVAAGLIVLSGYFLYLLMISFDALRTTRSLKVAFLSVPAALVQLNGYGSGFLKEMFRTGV